MSSLHRKTPNSIPIYKPIEHWNDNLDVWGRGKCRVLMSCRTAAWMRCVNLCVNKCCSVPACHTVTLHPVCHLSPWHTATGTVKLPEPLSWQDTGYLMFIVYCSLFWCPTPSRLSGNDYKLAISVAGVQLCLGVLYWTKHSHPIFCGNWCWWQTD